MADPTPLLTDTSGGVTFTETPFNPSKASSYSGRRFSCCNGQGTKILYTIALVIGAALLVAGILGVAGHCAQTGCSPSWHRLSTALSYIATKTGTDPLLLVSFTTAFGAALTFAGGFGLVYECKNAQPRFDRIE